MAYWSTIKFINSSLQITKNVFSLGIWGIWGSPEPEELKLARDNQEKLQKISQQLQQLWAVQTGMVVIHQKEKISEEEKNILTSMVVSMETGAPEFELQGNYEINKS